MGFHIKNNYGPNIEVNNGGKVTLVQGKKGLWHTVDAEDAEFEEVEEETLQPTPVDAGDYENDNCKPSTGRANDNIISLSASRQDILSQLLNLADKGDWVNGITSENVKAMLKAVLGVDGNLSAKKAELSKVLWRLLESGRGDRVKIVWQNMVGYLDDKKLFRLKGSPALNKDFFGDDKGYTNIDKGRPNKGLMTADFESITPLLDAYVPKLDKKT